MSTKPLLLIIALTGIITSTNAQQNEFSVSANTGFFRYGGDGSSSLTVIYLMPYVSPAIYNSPGRKSGSSAEFSLTAQRINRSRLIYGIDLAYQTLQSKTAIGAISPSMYSSTTINGEGSSTLTGQFIAISPLIGYRLLDKKIRLDLKAGLELAACLNRRESIEGISGAGIRIMEEHDISNKRADNRIRLQATTSLNRFGINTGYSFGVSNYYSKEEIGRPKAFSRFIRLGISYRFL